MKKCKYCQSEIDQKAKICPKCQKKQGMPNGLKIFLIIIGVIFLISMFGSTFEGNEPKKEQPENTQTKEALTLLEGHTGYFSDWTYYVEGYVQNNTNKEYSYVHVEFNLYDSEGAILGTADDYIDALEANGKWKFKATEWFGSSTEKQVASYRLKEITGW